MTRGKIRLKNKKQKLLEAGSKGGYWRYKNIRVYYKGNVNGGGAGLAQDFVDFIKELCPRQSFEEAFEWCGGPGFIGFALLANNLCKRLCIADINAKAIECAERTTALNHLSKRVSCFVSDNFDRVPKTKKFDLIVANPPTLYQISPKTRLRASDPKWRIHKKFYSQVSDYLRPGGLLIIHELEPFQTRVYLDGRGVPSDIRPRQPIIDFKNMISKAGLNYIGCFPREGLRNSWFVLSQKR